MKRLLLISLLLIATVANAEPNEAQKLKARGLLPDVRLSDVKDAALPEFADEVGEQQCGHPDAVDLEIAFAKPQDISEMLGIDPDEADGLQRAHEAMALAATGRGSWRPGCNPAYPGLHAVSYVDNPEFWPPHLRRPLTDQEFQSIIDARVWGPSGDPNGRQFTMAELKAEWGGKPMKAVINDFVEEAYRRFGVILYPIGGAGNITLSYPVIPGNVIGVAWYPSDGPCPGDRVNQHIDKTYTAGFQGQFGLALHETGHNMQLQHQFNGQSGASGHKEPLSYSYSQSPQGVVGFSTGDPVFGLPRAPSVAVLTRLYGGEPVGVPWKGKFATTPGPTPPPTGGGIQVGSEVTVVLHSTGQKLTLKVTGTDGDDGPTLGKRIVDALAAVPSHAKKEQHRQVLTIIYSAVSQSVTNNELTLDEAREAVTEMRTQLLGPDLVKWAGLLAIADTASSAQGYAQVAGGLGGNEALSPKVAAWIQTIAKLLPTILPTGKWSTIINLILAILSGLNDEEQPAIEPVEPVVAPKPVSPIQREGASIQPGGLDKATLLRVLQDEEFRKLLKEAIAEPADQKQPVVVPRPSIKFDKFLDPLSSLAP